MTHRDEIKARILRKLAEEFEEVHLHTMEYAVHADYDGTVNGAPIRIEVLHFPRGENPETLDGSERWSVRVTGSDGRELHQMTKPEPTLGHAFQSIDWSVVRVNV